MITCENIVAKGETIRVFPFPVFSPQYLYFPSFAQVSRYSDGLIYSLISQSIDRKNRA